MSDVDTTRNLERAHNAVADAAREVLGDWRFKGRPIRSGDALVTIDVMRDLEAAIDDWTKATEAHLAARAAGGGS